MTHPAAPSARPPRGQQLGELLVAFLAVLLPLFANAARSSAAEARASESGVGQLQLGSYGYDAAKATSCTSGVAGEACSAGLAWLPIGIAHTYDASVHNAAARTSIQILAAADWRRLGRPRPVELRLRPSLDPSVVAAEAGSGSLGLSTEESWGNANTLEDHFLRHGADFGATSADDYASQASEFLQRSQAEGLPTKIDADGVIRVYDPNTNTFGAYNADGTTRTFFKTE